MSSFVMMTEDGPPNLLVEVGDPISSDPVLLSGLFQAIVALSNEVTSTPLQVIQSDKFTVRFKYLENQTPKQLLIIGSTSNIYGIDQCISQVERLINEARENNISDEELASAIKEVLKKYLGGDKNGSEHDQRVVDALKTIEKNYLRLVFWGILSGYSFLYPETASLDFNRSLDRLFQFLEIQFVTKISHKKGRVIEFLLKDGFCRIDDMTHKKPKTVLPKLSSVSSLIKLGQKGKINELKSRLTLECEFLESLDNMFRTFLEKSEQEKHDLDLMRYIMGIEMEYFLFQRLEQSAPQVVEELRKSTRNLEWVNTW